MQAKEQKISPIKQRILQFAANLGISKRDFYAQIGVSRGTLESGTGITEDILAKFIVAFPDISLDWLLLDHGPMFREEHPVSPSETAPQDRGREISLLENTLADKDNVIAAHEKTIARDEEMITTQKQLILSLQQRIGDLERGHILYTEGLSSAPSAGVQFIQDKNPRK